MKLSRPLRLLLGLASGVALACSFPNYNLPLLAWVAVSLLILASIRASVLDAMMAGFLHGFIFYPLCLTWMYVVMRQYGNVGALPGTGIMTLIGITGGLHMMIFTTSLAFVSRRRVEAVFVLAPFLWLTLEFIRTHLPIISFPWNLSGYAASGNLALVQLTTLTGIYGLSFLIGAYNSLVAWTIWRRDRRAYMTLANRDGCVARDRDCRTTFRAVADAALHRAFGADEFSAIGELSIGLARRARGRDGRARENQRGRGAAAAGAGRLAGSACAVQFHGDEVCGAGAADCARVGE